MSIGKINSKLDVNDVIFSVHMPHPGGRFDPVQQFVVVSMNAEIDMQFNEPNMSPQLDQKKSKHIWLEFLTESNN